LKILVFDEHMQLRALYPITWDGWWAG